MKDFATFLILNDFQQSVGYNDETAAGVNRQLFKLNIPMGDFLIPYCLHILVDAFNNNTIIRSRVYLTFSMH